MGNASRASREFLETAELHRCAYNATRVSCPLSSAPSPSLHRLRPAGEDTIGSSYFFLARARAESQTADNKAVVTSTRARARTQSETTRLRSARRNNARSLFPDLPIRALLARLRNSVSPGNALARVSARFALIYKGNACLFLTVRLKRSAARSVTPCNGCRDNRTIKAARRPVVECNTFPPAFSVHRRLPPALLVNRQSAQMEICKCGADNFGSGRLSVPLSLSPPHELARAKLTARISQVTRRAERRIRVCAAYVAPPHARDYFISRDYSARGASDYAVIAT